MTVVLIAAIAILFLVAWFLAYELQEQVRCYDKLARTCADALKKQP